MSAPSAAPTTAALVAKITEWTPDEISRLLMHACSLESQLNDALITADRLTDYLYKVGICSDCGSEFSHDMDEPIAFCPKCCWQGEDTGGPPLLQQLRMQIAAVPK